MSRNNFSVNVKGVQSPIVAVPSRIVELEYLPEAGSLFVIDVKNKGAAISNKDPIILSYPDSITNIILSCVQDGVWVEITSENSEDLSADKDFCMEFFYSGVNLDELIEADGVMVYNDLPARSKSNASGTLLFVGEIVTRIQACPEHIEITFKMYWLFLQKEKGVGTLNGTIQVKGTADWRELPSDGSFAEFPIQDLNLRFEESLPQKYGKLDIEQPEPTLIEKEGNYYLKYTLTNTP